MGCVKNITYNTFPKQSNSVGKKARVVFHYDDAHQFSGVIVRDDIEVPYEMIIRLDDGRYIRSVECQYSYV